MRCSENDRVMASTSEYTGILATSCCAMRGRAASVYSRSRAALGLGRSSAPRTRMRAKRNKMLLKPAPPSMSVNGR